MAALQLFSMTKFITTVGPAPVYEHQWMPADATQVVCLQLVDEGILSLDDPDIVEKYCPELAKVPILERIEEDGKEITREKKNRITLRMLLAHTAGKPHLPPRL